MWTNMRMLLFLCLLLFVLDIANPAAATTAADTTTTRVTESASSSIHPNLPFGDINVIVLTDIHSWVGGHVRQEPALNVNYGNVLSFWERLKAHCEQEDMDIWFVNNGDCVHGTGLSGNGDISSLVPILQKMPWDAVNCGNHELYEESIVEYMIRPGGFVDWWGDKYLTANVMVKQQNNNNNNGKDGNEGQSLQPLGRHYKILQGKHSNLLVFGFLYNLANPCDLIQVHPVEAVVREDWFVHVLTKQQEQYDAILILAHMDLVDPLVDVILQAIRSHVGPSMPIQFITGHTHYRGVQQLDAMASSAEFGRYLDTIGFVSFPTVQTVLLEESPTAGDESSSTTNSSSSSSSSNIGFETQFIDANQQSLHDTLRLATNEPLDTHNGKALTDFITKTRQKMGLLQEIGCAPQDYHYNTSLDDPNSLWALYRDQVVPQMFFDTQNNNEDDDEKSIMLLSKESWRYDLYSQSTLIIDDIWAVAPFNDTITYMGTFAGVVLQQLHATLNDNIDHWLAALPNYIWIGPTMNNDNDDDSKGRYALYTHEYNANQVKEALHSIVPNHDIVPENTDYTSTMLWLSFVMEHWACNGLLGQLPDWFPKPDHLANKLRGNNSNNGNDDNVNDAIVITILVILGLILLTCLICLYMALKYICFGHHHQIIQEDELDALPLDNEDTVGNESEMEEQAATDTTLTDDDHEML